MLSGTPFFPKKNPGGHAGGLAKWGGITEIGFQMSKIPKCRLETYWANKDVFTCPKFQNVIWKPARANKEVFTCPKSQNVVWKPTGQTKRFCTCPKSQNVVWKPTRLTKRTFLFYGPMAPGAHRAHIFLINAFIYLC